MSARVRAKFTVTKVAQVSWSKEAREITLMAVFDKTGIPGEESYARYTSSGSIQMTVDNPPASEQLELGRTFYVDFTRADEPAQGEK